MAYLLNGIDLFDTYKILPGHAPGSNIALQGCFDLPPRIGTTFHEWGDEDGIEPFVAAEDMMFGGRDLVFTGSIIGDRSVINTHLDSLYAAVRLFAGIVVLSTPYGDFYVYVKTIIPELLNGGCSITMNFREPVVTLTGGTLPTLLGDANTIDSMPFSYFGIYLSKKEAFRDFPEMKDMLFTIYGAEGYKITKRKNNTLSISGIIIGTSLSDFQDKIKAVYKLFSSSGMRTVILNYEKTISCFAVDGFSIKDINVYNQGVIASFSISLICESISKLLFIDWFLPSIDALDLMINELCLYGLGNFGVFTYMSSSEYSATHGWTRSASSYPRDITVKASGNKVRACRAFTSATPYNLRDIGPAGGLVFWKSGSNYLESAPSDQGIRGFSNIYNVAIGTTGEAIGTGQANTNAIIGQSGHIDSAAKLCNDLVI